MRAATPLGVFIALLLGSAAPALAQTIDVLTFAGDGSGPHCFPYDRAPCADTTAVAGVTPCMTADSTMSGAIVSGRCRRVLSRDSLVCVPNTYTGTPNPAYTAIACCGDSTTAGACATFGGVCKTIVSSTGTPPEPGCVPSALVDAYCAGDTAISLATLRQCFTVAGSIPAVYTADFAQGDCDGDGVPNGCDSTRCPGGDTVDAGMTCPVEAGMPDGAVSLEAGLVDGGSTDDGGLGSDDAGPEDDAGASMDAGSNQQTDAGSGQQMDAGSGGHDDGGTPGFGGDVRGGGGCNCRAASGPSGDGTGAALGGLLLLGAVLARRRRGAKRP